MRALAKIMDFLRAVSILLVVMHLYWYCYEAILAWGVNIGVVDKILMNFDRTARLFHSILYTKLFALVLLALSCLGTKGVKNEKITWTRIWIALGAGLVLFFSELVDFGSAVTACCQYRTLHGYGRSRICVPADGGDVDEPVVEDKPDGRCV